MGGSVSSFRDSIGDELVHLFPLVELRGRYFSIAYHFEECDTALNLLDELLSLGVLGSVYGRNKLMKVVRIA